VARAFCQPQVLPTGEVGRTWQNPTVPQTSAKRGPVPALVGRRAPLFLVHLGRSDREWTANFASTHAVNSRMWRGATTSDVCTGSA
jgi:hypothetical protein